MLGFLIAIAAGAATPMAEGPIGRPLAQMLGDAITIEDGELRVLTFMLVMIAAALLSALLGTGTAPGLAVGGALGYFGARILRVLQRTIDARRG
jgi:hypothetical protein